MVGNQLPPRDAIKLLFEQYGTEIYQYIRYTLGDPMIAEDVVQEIFLRALKAWPKFEHRSSARTWLWSIVRNHLRDVLRQKKKLAMQVALDEEFIENFDTGQDSFSVVELESVLQSLTIPYRQVVTLRIIQDKSNQEVAELLGWTEAKVRVTFHRALKKLKQIFSEDEGNGSGHRKERDIDGFRAAQTKF